MQIDERTLQAEAQGQPPSATDVGWFAARQPGMVRYLEQRLLEGNDGDAFAVALEAAWCVCRAFERRDGVPPPRVERALLERAEDSLIGESATRTHHGCAQRQPAICDWILGFVEASPMPLGKEESRVTSEVLLAVVYALDELTTGRAVP